MPFNSINILSIVALAITAIKLQQVKTMFKKLVLLGFFYLQSFVLKLQYLSKLKRQVEVVRF